MPERSALPPRHADGRRRCTWCGTDPLYVRYHDEEWGVPLHDDRALFEMICLEGAQAGLSWLTVLRKRESYRRAFDGFDATRMAGFDARRRARLLADPGIVRHRLKIEAFVANARAYLAVVEREGSFAGWLWGFAPAQRRRGPRWRPGRPAVTVTAESEALSRALAREGFRFVGPTICYAFMQAVGMVDDHQHGCFATRALR